MTQRVHETVAMVVGDDFGRRVADRMGIDGRARLTATALAGLGSAPGSCVLAATGTPDPALRELLDSRCAAWAVPSAGLELMPARMVCGPAVLPGLTACHRCYRARAAQHGAGSGPYDEDEAMRGLPPGFGEHHVLLAAGLLGLALRELRTGPVGLGGTVRSASLVSGRVSQAAVVSVDRCARCGGRFRGDRRSGAVPGLAPIGEGREA